ncbi:hypothetical protein SETIT_2G161000v2 [Setaria italica]|uniref:Uncharacterized protein n=1 Tax=Setaria italica TaxID=4555 RepID=A0A368PZ75_SETIT|nr:hypothetical protein SETIT_2G161000v2 [Setaria italica]
MFFPSFIASVYYMYTVGVEEVSQIELKRDRERKRYANLLDLAREKKILKNNEGRRCKNMSNQALASQAPVFGSAQSVVTEVLTRSKTRGVINGMNSGSNNVEQVDHGIWESEDHGCFGRGRFGLLGAQGW